MQEPIRSVTFSGFNQQEMGTWPTKMQLGQQTHGLNQVTNQVTLTIQNESPPGSINVQSWALTERIMTKKYNCWLSDSLNWLASSTNLATDVMFLFLYELLDLKLGMEQHGTTCLKQKTHAFRVPMPEQEGVIPIVTSCDKWPVIHLVSCWWFEPLWKIWKSVGMIIPNIWKVIKFMFQTTNQVSFHLAAVHFSPSATTWMFRIWLPVASMQVASSGMQMK